MSYKIKISDFLTLLRYRFFVFAGVFPYLFGTCAAYYYNHTFDLFYFSVGFVGIVLSLIGVEAFNEYFDSEFGADFIFSQSPRDKIPPYTLGLGLLSFFFAFLIGVYLTLNLGRAIMVFAVLGFLAAAFYVGPPIKWAYRGLGETVIFLAYGPIMAVGSYYVQTKRVDFEAIFASLVPGFLILALAIVNEIPDYFQDKLVGKRNIVVRIGRKNSVYLYAAILFALYATVAAGLILKNFPFFSMLIFLTLPLTIKSIMLAKNTFDNPEKFVAVIRSTIVLYLVVIFIFIIGYLGK